MSKVGGALPAWYWPEGIPRRSPVPQQTLDRLIKRASSRVADSPAIIWSDRQITFTELLDTATALGQAVIGLCADDEVVAVVESDPGEALVLMLGVTATGKLALLADCSAPDATLAAQLAEAKAKVVLTASETDLANRLPKARLVTRSELDAFDGNRAKLRAVKAAAPAVIIPAGKELAQHSNYSLAAMATALPAFIPELKSMTLVAPPPAWRWESLTMMLSALVNGSPVVVGPLADIVEDDNVSFKSAYTMLLRGQADEMIAERATSLALRELRYVFVSTPFFESFWRYHLEALRGREVLPVWGTTALGPAVAAHPTWFPLEAHGIPLVNVRVLPVNPNSGEPSLVPWEMLESAEIGVESPSAMVGFVRKAADEGIKSGKIFRTHISASVDHVGVVVLHRPPKSEQGVER